MEEPDLRKYKVPSYCPVCKRLMKGSKSTTSYYSYGCCSDCFIQWVEGREQRWNDGWRPSEEQLEKFLLQFEPSYEF